jgi:hypothetical protein
MHRSVGRWIVPAVLVAALTAEAPPQRDSFSLVLVRDGTAWNATCESGCDWTAIGSQRPRLFGTSVVIDNHGLQGWLTRPDTTAAFVFRVTADGQNGWKATSLKGTAWKTLGFNCAERPCRARITDTGVEVVQAQGHDETH